MIRLLIVDDSPTETAILKHIFTSNKNIQIIGYAKSGKEAIELTKLLKPDIITMDIEMPEMDGLEATRRIMSECPTPIVIISAKVNKALEVSFNALEAGALTILDKPKNIGSDNFERQQKKMIDAILAMAEIKVIRRKFQPINKKNIMPVKTNSHLKPYEVIAIGTSLGGPQTLTRILRELPADFPLPILIVQHMMKGFLDGFALWLNNNITLNVKIAENREVLKPGTVYFAPDQFHLEVKRFDGHLQAYLRKSALVCGFCPSATVLLNSIAKVSGKAAIGALLTGMGNDGAEGLLELKKAGGHTIIQDEKSSVVFGMGNVALSLDAVDKIINLDQFAEYLINTSKKPQTKIIENTTEK